MKDIKRQEAKVMSKVLGVCDACGSVIKDYPYYSLRKCTGNLVWDSFQLCEQCIPKNFRESVRECKK